METLLQIVKEILKFMAYLFVGIVVLLIALVTLGLSAI